MADTDREFVPDPTVGKEFTDSEVADVMERHGCNADTARYVLHALLNVEARKESLTHD